MEGAFPETRRQILPLWEKSFDTQLDIVLDVQFHQVPLRFYLPTSDLKGQLQNFFPKSWQISHHQPVLIYWQSPSTPQGWDEIADPDCHFFENFVSQRDFLLKKKNQREFQLMAKPEIADGLFNFLRYFLPLHLLQQDKVLFHSSCVLDKNNQAFLFFGPSGAGKTTIASLCQQQGATVLGDDMNILSVLGDHLLVEPAALGQRIYAQDLFGEKFPVKNVFWLQKGPLNRVRDLGVGSLSYFLSSFANLFWDQLDTETYSDIFNLLAKINSTHCLYELEFNKTKEVWNYVQSVDQHFC